VALHRDGTRAHVRRDKGGLRYIPDPLGRLGKGKWVGEEDLPDPFGRIAGARREQNVTIRADGGAPLVVGSVGRTGTNKRRDVATIEVLLGQTGHLDLNETDGPTGYYGTRLGQAIKRFQKDHGLTADGLVTPDGETLKTIERQSLPAHREGTQVASASLVDPVTGRRLLPGVRRSIFEGGGGGGVPTAAISAIEILRHIFDGDNSSDKKKSKAGPAPIDPLPAGPDLEPPTDNSGDHNKEEFPAEPPEKPGSQQRPPLESNKPLIEVLPNPADELGQWLLILESRGSPETQRDTRDVAKIYLEGLKARGIDHEHTHGGHDESGEKMKERYIPHADHGKIGSARSDATITVKNKGKERFEDINTTDTWKDGKTDTARERRAQQKIKELKAQLKQNGGMETYPKSRRWTNREEWKRYVTDLVEEYLDLVYGPRPKS
jgi:peptidoglycan hydrolase-like protein with peptidoglycan-binding domain